ncbi:CHAD domain-containing protein [Craterilacuibacter sp.]|uniref:CHAD domain-containing protein n=1 Tax=Craterilacuibacter sp. TaxID=2870909 RepID=UPI003F350A13
MEKQHFAHGVAWQAARILNAEQALAGPDSPERDEAVHTLRLGLRALRTLLCFFRGKPLADAIRCQLAACYRMSSSARELEVGLGLLPTLSAHHPAALVAIRHQWISDLQCERSVLLLSLQPSLQAALAMLMALLADTEASPDKYRQRKRVRRHARRLNQRVQHCLQRALKSGKVLHWHAARLAIKRYRLWCEQFAAVMEPHSRRRSEALRPLQLLLGEFNDLENFRQSLAKAGPLYKAWRSIIAQRKSRLQRIACRLVRRLV